MLIRFDFMKFDSYIEGALFFSRTKKHVAFNALAHDAFNGGDLVRKKKKRSLPYETPANWQIN